ncbi:MAG: hypothetical protein KGI57_10895 [Hyphomicrobiales bacterium]|nr:hypothetical protein [Hyphomicrobiales bacterium]MDE2018198.1 hypothetical protein [Hyphomicrobiales bacterium]
MATAIPTTVAISEMGRVRVPGRLPRLDPSSPDALGAAIAKSFRREDFLVREAPE